MYEKPDQDGLGRMPCDSLKDLWITKFLYRSSTSMMSLQNLRRLVLHDSDFCELLPALGNLRCLDILEIRWMGCVKKNEKEEKIRTDDGNGLCYSHPPLLAKLEDLLREAMSSGYIQLLQSYAQHHIIFCEKAVHINST
ncbi:unnamed protein product [Prunus armeniaca]|uniref:R13L1/DRL21-like LRR repeat region domain-containing protein n=1 Tax=Prunus armeniaca TaxID=36596 RepID=A0A6J5WSS2_PRUAR|nr:unnamed protein product [Prunus armeniaca]